MYQTTLPATDHNLKDQFVQGSIDFPIQYYVDELEKYPNQEIALHWHPELEFYVVKGCPLHIQLGQGHFVIEEGNGAFINANLLHAYRPSQQGKSTHPNIVFSSELICPCSSASFSKYVQPIITNSEIPYILLEQSIPWQKEILGLLDKLFSLMQKYSSASEHYGQFPLLHFGHMDYESTCYELDIQILLGQIWSIIYTNSHAIPHIHTKKSNQLLQIRMQKMIAFIQNYYDKPITLNAISNAAGISKSEAARCFDSYLQTSPGQYLLKYRITIAQKLLKQKEDSISAIAEQCGFTSSSYFCKIFRREVGMTPMNYRGQ